MSKEKEIKQRVVIDRLSSEIKSSLFKINEIVCYYQDNKYVQNSICKELRKIHSQIDKMSTLNNL